jgi:hypothetical protein
MGEGKGQVKHMLPLDFWKKSKSKKGNITNTNTKN